MARRGQARTPSTNRAGTPIQGPFQGLFLDHPPHTVPPGGFSACNNVRVRFNQLWFKDLGWRQQIAGGGAVPLHIPATDTPSIVGGCLFTLTSLWQYLILVTGGGDIYAVNYSSPPPGFVDPTATGNAVFINPTYHTGTVSNTGVGDTTITGAGTAWNTAIAGNWRKNARVEDYIAFGGTTISDPQTTWHRIATVTADGTLTIDASPAVPSVPALTTYTIRQRLAPNMANSRVVCESFPNAAAPDSQDLLFITDHGGTGKPTGSIDPIVIWNPTITAAGFYSTVDFTCRKLRRFNNVMVYVGLYGTGAGATPPGYLASTSIQSSDNGAPRTSAILGFQGMVSDGAEPLQHAGIMGNQLLLYTGGQAPLIANQSMSPGQGGSIIGATFVGFPTIWQFATVVRGRGTLGAGLVAEFADRHQFIAQDGEYRYNGMFIQEMNTHVFRAVVAAVDYSHLPEAFNIIDPQSGELIWVLPTSANGATNPDEIWAAYTEHYLEPAGTNLLSPITSYTFSPITIRDAQDSATFKRWQCWIGSNPSKETLSSSGLQGALVGCDDGNLNQIGLGVGNLVKWGTASTGTGVVGSATFGARIVAGERARGLVKRVYPFVDEVNSTGTSLTITTQLWDRVGQAAVITDTETYTLGQTNRFVTPYRRGRVAQVTIGFTSAASDTALRFDGYDWDLPLGSPGGQR